MEIEGILKQIDEIEIKLNNAYEGKNIAPFITYFDDDLKYTDADGSKLNKVAFIDQTKKVFENARSIVSEYYRVKSSLNEDVFTERIARKYKLNNKSFLLFTKKQTIQIEEIYHWKKNTDGWKIVAIEVVLEEKY